MSSALTHKSDTRALATLPAVALILAANGDEAGAIELWMLAKSHPFIANSKWFEDAAGRELDVLVNSLPSDAAAAVKARARELNLWETVEQLLEELR